MNGGSWEVARLGRDLEGQKGKVQALIDHLESKKKKKLLKTEGYIESYNPSMVFLSQN